MHLPPDKLITLLQPPPGRSQPHTGLNHSAVMMILCDQLVKSGPETHVVFIMRTVDGSRHSGQIAFPGGKVESSDGSALAAALRETEEEIGIVPSQLEVLGSMGYFSTMTTGFDVAVFVARPTTMLSYSPQQNEVAAIFEIPLARLAAQFNPGLVIRVPADMLNLHFHLEAAPHLKFKGKGWPVNRERICIWGFTARVLHHFFIAILQ